MDCFPLGESVKRSHDWYLKWIATATLAVGISVNSLGLYPLGPIILIAGAIIWGYVACVWRDAAMITTNVVMALAGIGGLLYNYFSGIS